MGKTKIRIVAGVILGVIIFFVPVVWGADQGVADSSINIGIVCDYTGPLAGWGQDLIFGAKMYARYINEKGGIYGRRLELFTQSDNYQPAQTVAGVKKLLARDKVFAFTLTLGFGTLAAMPVLEEAKTPLVAPITGQRLLAIPPKRYIFPETVSHYDFGRLLIKFPVEIKKKKPAKIFVIYQDDDFGAEVLNAMSEQLKIYGMELIGKVGFKRGSIDFSSQMVRARETNPDVVLLVSVYTSTAQMMKEARRLEWKPAEPMFIAHYTSKDQRLLDLSEGAAEGLFVQSLTSPDDPVKNQFMNEYINLMTQYHPGRKPTDYPLQGYESLRLLVEGLKRAGKDLTREKFVDAMENLKNFETAYGPTVSYGPNKRTGMEAAKFSQVKEGKFLSVTDWISVD